MNQTVSRSLTSFILQWKRVRVALVLPLSVFLLLLDYQPLFSLDNFKQNEGFSFIHLDDIRSAKEMAIKDALTNVVIDVAEDVMMPLIFEVDREMLEERYSYNPQDFIREFSILSEKKEGDIFKVAVQAVVARDLLEKDLSDIGLSLEMVSFSRLLIMIREINKIRGTKSYWWKHDDAFTNGIAARTIAAELRDSNFDVIDPLNPPYKNDIFDPYLLRYSLGTNEIKEWGTIYGADLIISGETAVELLADYLTPSKGIFKTSTNAQIIDVNTGEEILSVFVQRSFISLKEEKEFESVLKGFFREIAKDLIAKLITIRKEEEILTNSVEVHLKGNNNYENYMAFKKTLLEMDNWVDSLREKRFSRGEVVMEIKIKGDPILFKDELRILDLKSANLIVSSFTNNRIFLELIQK